MIITLASYALQTPPRVANAKPPGPKERPKVGNNKSQIRIAMPPRVAHAKTPGPILNEDYSAL